MGNDVSSGKGSSLKVPRRRVSWKTLWWVGSTNSFFMLILFVFLLPMALGLLFLEPYWAILFSECQEYRSSHKSSRYWFNGPAVFEGIYHIPAGCTMNCGWLGGVENCWLDGKRESCRSGLRSQVTILGTERKMYCSFAQTMESALEKVWTICFDVSWA